MSTNKLDLFYPDAINWMWHYCTNLGKFTDSKGNNYDLGVFIDDDGDCHSAIVFDNEDGCYFSNELSMYDPSSSDMSNWHNERLNETYKRAKEAGLIN